MGEEENNWLTALKGEFYVILRNYMAETGNVRQTCEPPALN